MLQILVRSLCVGTILLTQLLLAPGAAAMDAGITYTLACSDVVVVDPDPFANCEVAVHYPAPVLTPPLPDAVITCDPPSGSLFSIGPSDPGGIRTTPVSCTARDPEGNLLATCTFTVTVRDERPPYCAFWITDPTTGTLVTDLVLVGGNAGVTLQPDDFTIDRGACSRVEQSFSRSDGLPFFVPGSLSELTPFPVGRHVITLTLQNALGYQSQCPVTLTVLSPFVALATQIFVRYRVPLPGEAEAIDLSGLAELKLQVRYPETPGGVTRVHAHLNLHGVTAIWNGVEYHATNNGNAHLTSDQITTVPLNLPGQYRFVARGQAAVKSLTLSLPLQGSIQAGVLSARIGEPQFVR